MAGTGTCGPSTDLAGRAERFQPLSNGVAPPKLGKCVKSLVGAGRQTPLARTQGALFRGATTDDEGKSHVGGGVRTATRLRDITLQRSGLGITLAPGHVLYQHGSKHRRYRNHRKRVLEIHYSHLAELSGHAMKSLCQHQKGESKINSPSAVR